MHRLPPEAASFRLDTISISRANGTCGEGMDATSTRIAGPCHERVTLRGMTAGSTGYAKRTNANLPDPRSAS